MTLQPQVAVVTDSAADLPLELAQQFDIAVVPLYLSMDGKTWRDGVDISPREFYKLLQTSKDFPKTSQPNTAAFEDLFRSLSYRFKAIVAVLVSRQLSGTVSSAEAARANLPEVPIEIINSGGVSMMEGFNVLAAAYPASRGEDLKTVVKAANSLIGKTHVYFVVDTFEYLYRGGRIGAAAKLLGSALIIKPVLEIRNGIAHPAAQVRTKHKALKTVIELLEKQAPSDCRVHMAVINVAAAEEASRFKDDLVGRFQPVELYETDVSPVLGAHVGPGTVGVAYYFE